MKKSTMVSCTIAGATVLGVVLSWRAYQILRQTPQLYLSILNANLNPILVTSLEEIENCVDYVAKTTSQFPVIGLDCEWGSNQKVLNGTYDENEEVASDYIESQILESLSLVQIALYDGTVFVIQLRKLLSNPDKNPRLVLNEVGKTLSPVLSDSGITKVGVGIDNDAKKIQNTLSATVNSWVDLRYLSLEFNQGHLRGMGLAKLSRVLLGNELPKDLQLSNWTVEKLSDSQLFYAANDAMVSLKILIKYFSIVRSARVRSFEVFMKRLKPFLNQKYKGNASSSLRDKSVCGSNRSNGGTRDSFQGKVPLKYLASSKNEIYSNGSLLAPDGQLLCTCSMNKLKWYCYKGLGEFVDEKSVKLFFEPANRPAEDSEYYRLPKKNCCVVCGREENMLRKNVVPVEYRKHFPPSIKSHQSHDTLVMCVGCHVESNWHDLKLRRALETECEAPIGAIASLVKKQPPIKLNKAIHAARALVAHMDMMPPERVEELKHPILDYIVCEKDESITMDMLSYDIIQDIAKMKHQNPKKEELEPHALKVCRIYVERGWGLEALKQRWRSHFLETMNPQYLPELWSIEHRPKFKGALIDDCSKEVLKHLENGGKYQGCLKTP